MIPVPFHAIVMLVYAKETCGYDIEAPTLIDEYIARIMKNCRRDNNRISKIDFRTMLNAHKVFDLYSHIKKQGGIMAVYPSRREPPVIDVMFEFIYLFKRMLPWRGIDDNDEKAAAVLRRNWILWYNDVTSSEEGEASGMTTESDAFDDSDAETIVQSIEMSD